jgi:hypothetical protein
MIGARHAQLRARPLGRAARARHREKIEVIVRRLEDDRAFLAYCVENVQRVALSPREELDMIGVLTDTLGSQGAAARALGKSPTWISKRKRVLATPALAAVVEGGEISLADAYDIATRAADEAAMLTQLERTRAGEQSQEATRDALTPCPRPVPTEADPAASSYRNRAVDRPVPIRRCRRGVRGPGGARHRAVGAGPTRARLPLGCPGYPPRGPCPPGRRLTSPRGNVGAAREGDPHGG